jgi:hypothetical protein
LIFCAEHDMPERVVFCCFSDGEAKIYRQTLAHLT